MSESVAEDALQRLLQQIWAGIHHHIERNLALRVLSTPSFWLCCLAMLAGKQMKMSCHQLYDTWGLLHPHLVLRLHAFGWGGRVTGKIFILSTLMLLLMNAWQA